MICLSLKDHEGIVLAVATIPNLKPGDSVSITWTLRVTQ